MSARHVSGVLFDLDDTLYDERSYVYSGFRVVAEEAAALGGMPAAAFYDELLRELVRSGRGKVFDRTLERFGHARPDWVARLVKTYRSHRPDITLFPEVPDVLAELRSQACRLGVVTDGLAQMQRAKLAALGLERLVDVVVCTNELGPERAKPHPEGYARALGGLGVSGAEAAFLGDDESRDFKAANDLGMLTIRVPGPTWGLAHDRSAPDPRYRAREEAPSLRAAVEVILEYGAP